jgi:hypothetical protein
MEPTKRMDCRLFALQQQMAEMLAAECNKLVPFEEEPFVVDSLLCMEEEKKHDGVLVL